MRLTTIILFGSLLGLVGGLACAAMAPAPPIPPRAPWIPRTRCRRKATSIAANVDGASTAGLTALTSDQVALAIVANIHAKWPNACAQVTANGSDITVVYNDCSGPRGLVHVTGTLDLDDLADDRGRRRDPRDRHGPRGQQRGARHRRRRRLHDQRLDAARSR